MLRRVLLLLSICGSAAATESQELVVELYRGLVRIETHSSSEIEIEASLVDYDRFVEGGGSIEEGMRFRRQPAGYAVQRSETQVLVVAPEERQLVELHIKLPASTPCRVDVAHFGEIFVSDVRAPLDLRVFNGRISAVGLSESVSAELLRDGSIDLRFAQLAAECSIVASIYSGPLRVGLPQGARVQLDARSHGGDVEVARGVQLRESGPSLLLRAVRGDIEVTTTDSP